jgi:hypothetical protein
MRANGVPTVVIGEKSGFLHGFHHNLFGAGDVITLGATLQRYAPDLALSSPDCVRATDAQMRQLAAIGVFTTIVIATIKTGVYYWNCLLHVSS